MNYGQQTAYGPQTFPSGEISEAIFSTAVYRFHSISCGVVPKNVLHYMQYCTIVNCIADTLPY
jgi:hypothetical protein